MPHTCGAPSGHCYGGCTLTRDDLPELFKVLDDLPPDPGRPFVLPEAPDAT